MEQPLPPLREKGTCFHPAGSGQIGFSDESYPACATANERQTHLIAAKWSRVNPPEKKSGGQTGASLLAAALDDVATGGSSHAGKESEPTFAAAVGGLESSLHFLFVLFFRLLHCISIA